MVCSPEIQVSTEELTYEDSNRLSERDREGERERQGGRERDRKGERDREGERERETGRDGEGERERGGCEDSNRLRETGREREREYEYENLFILGHSPFRRGKRTSTIIWHNVNSGSLRTTDTTYNT